MRRLPVYILIDTSGSMRGKPIETVRAGLEAMLYVFRADPFFLEAVSLSIITFDRDAKCLFPLTPIYDVRLPEITTSESVTTNIGAALSMLCSQVDMEVIQAAQGRKGDFPPFLFLMTAGEPADLEEYHRMVPEVNRRAFDRIIAYAGGMDANAEPLKLLTEQVYMLDTMDGAGFKKFSNWVMYDPISVGNRTMGVSDEITLPPPPDGVYCN